MSADGDYSAVQLLNVSGKLHSMPAGLNLGVTLSVIVTARANFVCKV